MTKKDALKKIKELQTFIEDCDKEEDGQWFPKINEIFYFLDSNGNVEFVKNLSNENKYAFHAQKIGNLFKSEAEAEQHKLRLQSMASKPFLPKMGEEYWYIWADDDGFQSDTHFWDKDYVDQEFYLLGRIRRTEEECQSWIDTYAESWKI